MDRLVPWSVLCALIEPVYPKAGNGRSQIGLERMLRIYFLQNWFNLSDPAVEEALYDSLSMRNFVGIDLGREGAPDETTVCKFRHPLPQLLHGNENRVYGDSTYTSQKALITQAAPKAKDFTNQKASRHKPLSEREREMANGLDGAGEALRILVNEASKIERAHFLNAQPYERTAERNDYANGFKPKTVMTRLGKLTFAVPQVRGGGFYPSALEKGTRTEQALNIALAEMYVQGVSTRKATDVLMKLLGPEVSISSTQVSRAAEQLDAGLAIWRERPLDETPYVFLDARYERVREAGRLVDCRLLAYGNAE